MHLRFVLSIGPVTFTVNDGLRSKRHNVPPKEIQWSKVVIRGFYDARRIVVKWITLTSRDRSDRLVASMTPYGCQNELSDLQEVHLLVSIVPYGKKCDLWQQMTARRLHNVQLQLITRTRDMAFQWYCIIFCSFSAFLFTYMLHCTSLID